MASRDISKILRMSWNRLSNFPLGRRLFSVGVGLFVPYSGTISALVEELKPGYAKVSLKDRKRVRNHLNSVHAIALANLAEITSGIALIYSLPDRMRGILIGFEISYQRKARGNLIAESTFNVPPFIDRADFPIHVKIFDSSNAQVAEARALWRIGSAKAPHKKAS